MSIIVACAVIHRDGYRCVYCEKPLVIKTNDASERAEIDHLVPRNNGGATVPTNLVTACRQCNMARRWDKLHPRKVLDAVGKAQAPINRDIGRALALQHYPSRFKSRAPKHCGISA